MAKKGKVGKQRRDKFYHLAKESGFRSRAAFKLIQLNRKFGFLQNCRVVVDLCAAPGGWLQVAAKFCPISSLVIGVDLVPIRPIPNVISMQGDITTDSCAKSIQKELQTWSADCVLHDGAPNVGTNWLHDAFMQAQLTLSALKLATSVLKKGGVFVTKVFRSKDYPALLPVFNALFKKVNVTKPVASRAESAEIFVYCEGYRKPAKVPPELLDPKTVFLEAADPSSKPNLSAIISDKKKKRPKAVGYDEDNFLQYRSVSAEDFVKTSDVAEYLQHCSAILVNTDYIKAHPATTDEVLTYCADIKVLGPREMRLLLKWRKQIKQTLSDEAKLEAKASKDAAALAETESPEVPVDPEVKAAEEQAELDTEVERLKQEESKEKKKLRRKEMREKRKLRDRIHYKMTIPGDKFDFAESDELFSLGRLKDQLSLVEQHGTATDGPSASGLVVPLPDEDLDEDGEDGMAGFDDSDEEEDMKRVAEIYDQKMKAKAEALLKKKPRPSKAQAGPAPPGEDLDEDGDFDEPSTSQKREFDAAFGDDGDEAVGNVMGGGQPSDGGGSDSGIDLGEGETDAESLPDLKKIKLDPHALAVGEQMIYSSKTRRDMIEWGYNRYAFNDDNVPTWFADDEKKHNRKHFPVTKEQLEYYRERQREIDARPIKKVAEAKARKKKTVFRRMEKARKKANLISSNEELSEQEKTHEMKRIYKATSKAVNKKPQVTYVVSKKHNAAKRVRRPEGVNGQFRLVDKRMKTDIRAEKRVAAKRSGGGKKSGGKSGGRGGKTAKGGQARGRGRK